MREANGGGGINDLIRGPSEDPVIRVVVVESRRMLRQALTALLGHEQDLVVVAEAHDALACYDIVDKLDPDVVLIDAHMPEIDGIAATRELLRRSPLRKIIVVTWAINQHIAAQAMAAGARGYLAKEDSADELIRSLRNVARGVRHLSCQLRPDFVDGLLGGRSAEPIDRLSPRERGIFELLVRGQNNGAIATALSISIRTVETHRAGIMRKLDLHSLAAMVRFAAAIGVPVSIGGE